VRDTSGRVLLATQLATRPGGLPLKLTSAPAGAGARAAAGSPVAYAGRFRRLRATGSVTSSGLTARTTHRFTPSFVETRWSVRGVGGRIVDVLFPSWGRRSAQVWAIGRDGHRTLLGGQPVRPGRIGYLHVRSAGSGYVVVPAGGRFTAGLTRPARQDSAPNPGPTLSVRLAVRANGAGFTARLAPATTPADADRVAARLARSS
jgi:hypothetical protein